jgi:hypothetical protein
LLPNYPHEVEWTIFQSHYVSKNVVALVDELQTSGCVSRKSDHYTIRAVVVK